MLYNTNVNHRREWVIQGGTIHMTNELIKIQTNEQGQKLVSGRELHEVLGIKSRFNDWIRNMVAYGFVENVDYTKFLVQCIRGQNQYDYILTLEMAKHIAMVQRTEIGMQVRNYFIECEKMVQQVVVRDSYMIEDPIERAKRWIEEQEEKRALELLTQQQQETIKEQEVEIEHKEDVIITLVEDVDLMTKRQRITQIVKYGSQGRYSERWTLLYKEFETKYHIDVNRRMKRAKENGTFKKSGSKLEYICDVMGMTSQLFDVCVVIFEADYKDMLQYYLDLAKGE